MRLSKRDKQVLHSIGEYRYLMSGQVQRLHFTEAATPSAALRAACRTLRKLADFGLTATFSRRIGGVRAGSASLVWYLTHAGKRLLRLHEKATQPLGRFFQPSPYFLAHTLAVAETAVQLTEMGRKNELELSMLQVEPECWRPYSERGAMVSLKPDLYAVTLSDEYEDRYFFEIDLDTESPSKVIEKCQKYHQYYRSGLEQGENGVFPLTVWVAPHTDRKECLAARIRSEFAKQPRIFSVITADELKNLISQGGDESTLC